MTPHLRRAALPILLLAIILASLLLGEVTLAPATLWHGLTTGEGPGALTLRVLRGPRLATALGAGAMLGVAGAIFQMLLRNPLAAPDVMGFNAGAGLAVIIALALGLKWGLHPLPMPLVAAAGGIAAAALVGLLTPRGTLTSPPLTLILVGLGVGFTATGLATFVTLTLPDTLALEARRWTTGSLAARNWGHAAQVWSIGAALILALALQTRTLGLLQLGPALATGLGVRVRAARGLLITTAIGMAATGVAVAGPIPFIALMAGPLGQGLAQTRTPAGHLAAAGCAGAIITAAADLLARCLFTGTQLPVGVMTGLLGAPYLLWLLARQAKRGTA